MILADNTRLEILDDCICRRCSFLKTRETLKDIIAELEEEDLLARQQQKVNDEVNGHSHPQPNGSAKTNGSAHTMANGVALGAVDGEDSSVKSSEKKKKKRKKKKSKSSSASSSIGDKLRIARFRLAVIERMIEEGRLEEEVGDYLRSRGGTSGLGDMEGFEIDRVFSRCSTRHSMIARVSEININLKTN